MFQFPVNKSLIELTKIKIKINSIKFMYQCSKSIMKEFKICLFQFINDPNKVLRSGRVKLLEFMSKDYQNIMWILMMQSSKKWLKEEKTDQSLQLKWMLVRVELIQLSQFSSGKNKLLKTRNDKNYLWYI